ncbi:hypothetical protein ACJJTC_008966 [Scirpophaga incertulas]
MKLILGVVAINLFAVVLTAPSRNAVSAVRRAMPAIHHEEVHDELGQYALRYMTAEGTIVSERGRLVPTHGSQAYVLVVEGETSYIGDDGKTYVTKYSAGLDGAHAEGSHIPTTLN